jgi:hypothetical protein
MKPMHIHNFEIARPIDFAEISLEMSSCCFLKTGSIKSFEKSERDHVAFATDAWFYTSMAQTHTHRRTAGEDQAARHTSYDTD